MSRGVHELRDRAEKIARSGHLTSSDVAKLRALVNEAHALGREEAGHELAARLRELTDSGWAVSAVVAALGPLIPAPESDVPLAPGQHLAGNPRRQGHARLKAGEPGKGEE